MADTLRELEKGYEAKFKLDEESRFKIRCRCHRLFGLWAAGQLGKDREAADSYARSLVRLGLDAPRSAAVLEAVVADFAAAGVRLGEIEVKGAYRRFEAEAAAQVGSAYPSALDGDHVQVGG